MPQDWRRSPFPQGFDMADCRDLDMPTAKQDPLHPKLSKATRDIFNKGFDFGLVNLRVKTQPCSGVEFSTSGSSHTDTGKVSGALETKYKCCDCGPTFTEKWNSGNSLGAEVTVEDQIYQYLKLTYDTTFSQNTERKVVKIKSAYRRACINLSCDVDFPFPGPAIHGAAVWLQRLACWVPNDQCQDKADKEQLSTQLQALQLHTNVNNETVLKDQFIRKRARSLDTSASLAGTSGPNCTRSGIATKCQLDPTASISAWLTALF